MIINNLEHAVAPIVSVEAETSFGPHSGEMTRVSFVMDGMLPKNGLAAIKECIDKNFEPHLRAKKVIFNGPAAIALYNDGTKTVSKCKDGDEYDPLFGLLACFVRKLTRNRGHAVDDYETELRAIASDINKPEDVKRAVKHYSTLLGTLMMLDESTELWLDQLGEHDNPTFKDTIEQITDDMISDQEAMRQTVRDLIDRGEL